MTTRPGYVWDNTASEWVTIGPVALPGSTVFYQASAPSSPATGDIWIDSDDDVPSIDSSVFYRWKETAAGGETTLSGNDDNGLALKYTPGYEELYINGVLQVRGSDYVATTGTTITGLTALVAGDIVTVMSQVAYTVGDTYTQGAADAKFVSKNVGGLNLVIPTSVTGGTVSANGAVTINSGVTSININGVFSATYDNYRLMFNKIKYSGASNLRIQMGTTATGYYYTELSGSGTYATASTLALSNGSNADSYFTGIVGNTNGANGWVEVFSPYLSELTTLNSIGSDNRTDGAGPRNSSGFLNNTTSYTSLTVLPNSGQSISSGTIRIYGYNNGA
jgi:hypothetical protein